VATNLVTHALPILRSWVRTGKIFSKVAHAGRPVSPPSSRLYRRLDAEVDDIVYETMAAGLRRLTTSARTGRGWSPRGGSSLTSYFVGACVHEFSNIYRSWYRRAVTESREVPTDEPFATEAPDAADVALAAVEFSEFLASVDGTTRSALGMMADGLSFAEIGNSLGISPRAVEGRLHRLRRRLTAHPKQG
jgi:DNA-directed RNA polymerase specialized sigma24 family protein